MTTSDTAERILVIAEHKHIADLWVKLNADALRNHDREVSIVTSGDSLHLLPSDRLIVIGRPDADVQHYANKALRLGGTTIRVQHSDRLAAGWRTA